MLVTFKPWNSIVLIIDPTCQGDLRGFIGARKRHQMIKMVLFGSFLFLSVFIMLSLLVTKPSYGEIFRYIDENGVVHFSNVPVDSRYKLYLRTHKSSQKPYTPDRYNPIIRQVSDQYDVDWHLVRAVIKAESDFDPSVVSKKGAKGLMQLMPETAQDMNVKDVFDPHDNINGGVKYLRRLLDMFNEDLPLTLAAYNAGENVVRKYNLQIPPYKETQEYVKKVLRFFDEYKNGDGKRKYF